MKHTSREDTPLKYHSFFRYFVLPLNVIYTVFILATQLRGAVILNGFYILDLLFMAANIVLCITAFIGFFKWKPYAWYSTMALLVVRFVYGIVVLIIFSKYTSFSGITSIIVSQLFSMAVTVLIVLYYYKRKLLFFEGKFPLQYAECGAVLNESKKDEDAPPHL